MSSVEIEDVLSSIRRLVSEDLRPMGANPAARPVAEAPVTPRAPAPMSSVAADMAASKLILTPALRVVSDDLPAQVAAETDAAAWDDGEVAAFVNVEDDAVLEDDTGWQTSADVVSLTRAEDAPRLDASPMAATDDHDPAPVLGADAMDWEADAQAALAAPDWQDAQPQDAAMSEDLAPDAVEIEAELLDDTTADPAFDAVWADAAEAEVLRQLAEDGTIPQAPPRSDDDMVYEENLLRDLVRDIIREELQGALGERITRNVRKLVRAEIARAMALRDFD
ncbi:MAG: hypothetical protein CFE34_08560 [Rhodobacteraceae bacterium PARR1]|nr:MAG: hypothetical protein CFE34_08560 [Rhodobacteraceae bacterium PARR1]